MRTVRNCVFETNSSSCHVITVLSDNELALLKNGALLLSVHKSQGDKVLTKTFDKWRFEQEIKELEKQLSCIYKSEQGDISYYVARDLTNYYNDLLQIKRPLQKELTLAEKYFKTTGDNSDIIAYNKKLALYDSLASAKISLE